MENKYYKPTIEEFHVGFEYEYWDTLGDGHYDWFEGTYYYMKQTDKPKNGGHVVWSIDSLIKAINDLEIRVKYLDREDIESMPASGKTAAREPK